MAGELAANTVLTIVSPAATGGLLVWVLKKWFDGLSSKVDKSAAETASQLSRVHERIDRYEQNQSECQLNLHKFFAQKGDVEKIGERTEHNTERIVRLETVKELFQKGGV